MGIFFGPAAELLLSFVVSLTSAFNTILNITELVRTSLWGTKQPVLRMAGCPNNEIASFLAIKVTALPTDPSKASSDGLHAAQSGTRKR
jgi:hypothetical protein